MGKRLSEEQKEARLKAIMDARAEKIAEREARKKRALEERENRKKLREVRRKAKVGRTETPTKDPIKQLPPFKGEIAVGDEVGFRWVGMCFSGKVISIDREQSFKRIEVAEDAEDEEQSDSEESLGMVTYYVIESTNKSGAYPVERKDIVCKRINGNWKGKE